MPKMRLRPGLCPGRHWESLQCSPNPQAGFKGPTSKGKGGQGRGGDGRGGEGKGRRQEGKRGRGKGEGKGKCHNGTSFSPLRALHMSL